MKNKHQHHNSDNCLKGVQNLTHDPQLLVAQNIYIAYSGGIDSHVLMHLCASIDLLKPRITAVYVNHGLQVEAESWGLHCQQTCENLGVKFLSLTTNAQALPGESPEEAARNARYDALKQLLAKDDLLLVAQHAEDQLETVLLQLFRGSGLKGLSGMPESMAFGQGKLVRPLLDVSKNALIDYAEANQLQWIEDPSNQHTHFDRNFLRNDIIPLLKQRWPSLDKTVSRSAKHCANTQELIDTLSGDLLTAVIHPSNSTLNLTRLEVYPLLQQQLVIRQWFHHLGLKMPSQGIVQGILAQVVEAREDAGPVLTTQSYCIRRYRDALYCLEPTQNCLKDNLNWPSDKAVLKLTDDIIYETETSSSGIPTELWRKAKITVKFRSGGETIELPGRKGHHDLKKLYQEAGIPPWERPVIPLIFLDDKLASVGEHWISNEFYSDKKEPCLHIIRHKINPKGDDDAANVD